MFSTLTIMKDAFVDGSEFVTRSILANEVVRFRAQSSPISLVYDASIPATDILATVVDMLVELDEGQPLNLCALALRELEAHLLKEVESDPLKSAK
jgi:hypothetical protein